MKSRSALAGCSALLLAIGGACFLACSSDDSDDAGTPSVTKDAAADDAAKIDASAGSSADASLTDGASDATVGPPGAGPDASEVPDAKADTGAATDSGSIADAGPDADAGGFVDIYACGTPHDCSSGQSCVITAYSGWDGGDFPASTGCKLEAANGTRCKAAPLPSDVQVCAALEQGGFTPCPTGTTCQVVQVFGKDFGACLSASPAGCKASAVVPHADDANYCFAANTTGGCTSPDVVCCDRYAAGVFTASCSATVVGCN